MSEESGELCIENIARMLHSITLTEGRFDLTDNLKRSKNYEEFSDAMYSALRVAQTIQKRGNYVYIPSDKDLQEILIKAKDKEKFVGLRNTIACLALSYLSPKKEEAQSGVNI
jgi:hypothetical protein